MPRVLLAKNTHLPRNMYYITIATHEVEICAWCKRGRNAELSPKLNNSECTYRHEYGTWEWKRRTSFQIGVVAVASSLFSIPLPQNTEKLKTQTHSQTNTILRTVSNCATVSQINEKCRSTIKQPVAMIENFKLDTAR